MDRQDIIAAAREIRPMLEQLLGPAAGEIARSLDRLLAQVDAEPRLAEDIHELLLEYESTRLAFAALLPQDDTLLTRRSGSMTGRGVPLPPGTPRPIPAPRFRCPVCRRERSRARADEQMVCANPAHSRTVMEPIK